jgi:hypothetical protein
VKNGPSPRSPRWEEGLKKKRIVKSYPLAPCPFSLSKTNVNYQKIDIMETLIRIMANNRTYQEQTDLVDQIHDLGEFVGVAVACLVVLAAMTLA